MKIGFLPLYVKLYDDAVPTRRIRLEAFYEKIADIFEQKGLEVVKSPFCRIENEFKEAVEKFEKEEVDAIVTLHMAYSPSLECIDALSKTELPIIILDTTETLEFTNTQDQAEVAYCHGIHGVMDMCSMLTRYGKDYAIAAGHYIESDCIDRVCGFVRAVKSAKALKGTRTAIIGEPFVGMGDFQVPAEELSSRFGIEIVKPSSQEMIDYRDSITEEEIDETIKKQKEKYIFDESVIEDEYKVSVKSNLTIRKMLKEKQLDAFTINFNSAGPDTGVDVMPFVGCCEAMEDSIGYAGEGDTLTASFMGALVKGYPETNFIEIFCPDWKNNLIFLSHMGEMNYAVAAEKPVLKRNAGAITTGVRPYMGYAGMKGGNGVFVNICRGKDDYKLIISECEIVSFDEGNFGSRIRGWLKPQKTTAEFLKDISVHGGTHHSIFVYGATAEELEFFAKNLNLEAVII